MREMRRIGVPACAAAASLMTLIACGSRDSKGGPAGMAGEARAESEGASGSGGIAAGGGSRATRDASAEASQNATGTAGAPAQDGPFCEGAAPAMASERACRNHAECGPEGRARCDVPLGISTAGCGFGCACPPAAPIVSCSSHDDCGDGRCHLDGPFGGPCISNFCEPSCLQTGCGDGFTCNADRVCEANACDAGFTCPDGQRCAPEASRADQHGCEPLPCDQGYACPQGTTCRPEHPRAAESFGCVTVHCSEPNGPSCPENSDCVADAGGAGCVLRVCERDADCDCGACVNGTCAARTGVCMTLSVAGG